MQSTAINASKTRGSARRLPLAKFGTAAWITAIFVSFFLFASVSGQNVKHRPGIGNTLNRKVPSWAFKNKTTIQALLFNSKVKGGVVYSDSSDLTRNYQFQPKSPRLKDVLDSVVEAAPSYRWELKNNLIYLFPKAGIPSLLSLVISEFQVAKISDFDRFDHLEQSREFQQKAKELGYANFDSDIVRRIHRLGYDVKFSLDCRNSTVMEILDVYARKSGRDRWSFVEYDRNGKMWFDVAYA
jgi:hypothetical protein